MIASSFVIKKTAKTLMQGKWLRYFAISAIPVFLALACAVIPELFYYTGGLKTLFPILLISLGIFVVFPVYLGTLRVFWRMYMGVNDPPIAVFHYFGDMALYKRAFSLIVRLLIKIVGFGIIFLAPAIITGILSKNTFYTTFGLEMPDFATNFGMVTNVLSVLGVTVTAFVCLCWYLAPFFFVICDYS